MEHMGRKPDHGRTVRRGGTVVGWLAHRGDGVAGPEAHLGLALVDVVLGLLLLEFCDFRDRILLYCRGVLPSHLFHVYLYAQHVETNTYIQKEIESK